jgi:hypothetical protein
VEGQILVYINRNIQIGNFINQDVCLYEQPGFTTEHISANDEVGDNSFATAVVQLSNEDVIELAAESVRDTLHQLPGVMGGGKKIVVGYSGGGDSNLLLTALLRAGMKETQIVPTMVMGISDWDRQVDVAKNHCNELGLRLNLIKEEQAARLAKLDSVGNALTRFRREFPDTGKEFFGTWLLRKVLTEVARLYHNSPVFIGTNREDVLAEALYLLAAGMPPLPFPVREIDGIQFVSPLFKLPKKVIDGAYPSYSIKNYLNRDESDDRGRSIFYYLVYMMQDCLPGVDLTLLQGLRQLCSQENLVWDDELADHVLRTDTGDAKESWKRVLNMK